MKFSRFFQSPEWRAVVRQVVKRDGAICRNCSRTRFDGVQLHGDHIKPRSLYPELALDPDNVQILCEICNKAKGAREIEVNEYNQDEGHDGH
jgi:5-methylcytosine-specific restriction endonuclease McrA